MSNSVWEYIDSTNRVVSRVNSDGTFESKLVVAKDVQEWLAAGNIAKPYVEPPAAIPGTVLMYQARLALLGFGVTAAMVEAVIASLPSLQAEQARIQWEYSPTVKRENGFVSQLGPALGLSKKQIDELFVVAAGL